MQIEKDPAQCRVLRTAVRTHEKGISDHGAKLKRATSEIHRISPKLNELRRKLARLKAAEAAATVGGAVPRIGHATGLIGQSLALQISVVESQIRDAEIRLSSLESEKVLTQQRLEWSQQKLSEAAAEARRLNCAGLRCYSKLRHGPVVSRTASRSPFSAAFSTNLRRSGEIKSSRCSVS